MKTRKHYSREILEPIVKSSKTYKECFVKLNIDPHGANYKTIQHWIKEYDISTNHFQSDVERMKGTLSYLTKIKIPLDKVLIPNSSYSRACLKKRLYAEGLKKRQCEMCEQAEDWKGKRISLILDHINGINNDNTLTNLRIICPNCAATLDTHGGKNNKRKITYCSQCKKNEIWKTSTFCVKCMGINRRKIERPPYEILKTQADELGYCATGRIYGVTDHAIRKWLKWYVKFDNAS